MIAISRTTDTITLASITNSMITLYEMILEASRQPHERDTRVAVSNDPPQVGDRVFMGGDRSFEVVAVEVYEAFPSQVYVAFVHPVGEAVPSSETWSRALWLKNYPQRSFNIQLAPDRTMLGYGWSMDGIPKTGRLSRYEPTEHSTLMQEIPLAWVVDLIDTYKSVEGGTYSAIHVCNCLPAALPELAVA